MFDAYFAIGLLNVHKINKNKYICGISIYNFDIKASNILYLKDTYL
jgi:hypothetical protein